MKTERLRPKENRETETERKSMDRNCERKRETQYDTVVAR